MFGFQDACRKGFSGIAFLHGDLLLGDNRAAIECFVHVVYRRARFFTWKLKNSMR